MISLTRDHTTRWEILRIFLLWFLGLNSTLTDSDLHKLSGPKKLVSSPTIFTSVHENANSVAGRKTPQQT